MNGSSPQKPISIKENSAVKHLRSLSEPKYRKSRRAFLIEGVKMVQEALQEDADVVQVVVASPALLRHQGKGILKLAQAKSVGVLWVTERLLDAVSEAKTPPSGFSRFSSNPTIFIR